MYFVNAIEHATTVLKSYKIDFIFADTGVIGLDGTKFPTKAKKDFPNIAAIVTSKNLQERYDFLVNGADNFVVEPIVVKEVLSLLG